jgi:CRISPR/Cas system-associated exonuclease Cas4 (RecB family)
MMSIVVQAVKAYYERARQPRFPSSELRLSETGDCPRKRVLLAIGAQPTHHLPEESLRTMETGRLWEEWLVARIRETVKFIDTQVVVETPYGATGHIDIVVAAPDGWVIVEVKAVSQWAKELPDPRHVAQVQAYLHFWGRHHGVTRAQIVYIHRETGGGPFPYDIEYSPAMGQAIEEALAELRAMVEAQRVPDIPAEMERDKFPCYFRTKTHEVHCQFYGHCWGEVSQS